MLVCCLASIGFRRKRSLYGDLHGSGTEDAFAGETRQRPGRVWEARGMRRGKGIPSASEEEEASVGRHEQIHALCQFPRKSAKRISQGC